jgi:hypothetical protein
MLTDPLLFSLTSGASGGTLNASVNDIWWGPFIDNNMGLTTLSCAAGVGNPCNGLGVTQDGMGTQPIEGDGMAMSDALVFQISGGSVAVNTFTLQLIGYNAAACSGASCPGAPMPTPDADADVVNVYVHYSTDASNVDHVFNSVGAAAISSSGLLTFGSITGIDTSKLITSFSIQATDGSFLIQSAAGDGIGTPEPASAGLLAVSLVGLGFLFRRKSQKS